MAVRDGLNYLPASFKPAEQACQRGEFPFAAVCLNHGHIYAMCQGLIEAGGTLVSVWDSDKQRLKQFQEKFPQAKIAPSLHAVLDDKTVLLVAAAAVTDERGSLGLKVQAAGKHYFTDKTPFTTLEQLAAARASVAKTGLHWFVYYSERIHVEAAVYAGYLIDEGAIGKVIQVLILAPHNLNAPSRPAWFFQRARYGGILNDIGSHQIDQFLFYCQEHDARLNFARVDNLANPQYPELQDFGEASFSGANGSSFYFRLDWLNPTASRTWGDGRCFILGTKGYMEIRKYVNVAVPAESPQGNHLFLVNDREEKHIQCSGTVGFPFFGALIRDCLQHTDTAMPQAHTFKVAELALQAQKFAEASLVK